MKIIIGAIFVLASLSLVWTKVFPTAKPIHECLPTPASALTRIPLENLEVDPKCEDDYCPVDTTKGTIVTISTKYTPKVEGTALTTSVYETKTNSLLGAVGLSAPFHTVALCDKAQYNISCPFQANIPLHGFYKGKMPDVNFPIKSGDLMIKVILRDNAQRELMCYDVKIRLNQ